MEPAMTGPKVRRSALFMPGSNARALEKARELDADVVIFDLEDSVAPAAKEEARGLVADAVGSRAFGDREVVVRINPADSPEGAADLEAVLPAGPDAILLPKVEDAEIIAKVCAALDESHAPRGLALWAMIETPKAILNLKEIAETGARRRLAALVAGSNDLAEMLRVPPAGARAVLHPLLMQVVVAARAHGLLAFDCVYNDHTDTAGFTAEARQARSMGFDGKSLIHPSQIAPCHEAFRPTQDELDFARRVVAAFQVSENLRCGVIAVDGRMVERLHYDAATRVLALAGEEVNA